MKKIPRARKWLIALLASLLTLTLVLGAIVINLYFTTRVTLVCPDDIYADITDWDWGKLYMFQGGDYVSSTQNVSLTSYGAIPLTLTAYPNQSSMLPSWFTPHFYTLEWSHHAYEIEPLETINTRFNLTVDISQSRGYMIPNRIREIEIHFGIIIDGADTPLPQYDLKIEAFGNGTTNPAPATYTYTQGTTVQVDALPDFGYELDYFNLDGSNSSVSPIDVLMNADHNLSAYFKVAVPKVIVVPALNNYGVGQQFTIVVRVENIMDLNGFDIKFAWDASLLSYVSHLRKCPVETYPDGIIHEPSLPLRDDINATAGTYWCAFSTLGGAPFNGSGIAFEITFEVLGVGSCTLDITSSSLANTLGQPITHDIYDGTFDNTA